MLEVRDAWIVDIDDRKAAMVATAVGIPRCRLPGDLGQLPPVDIAVLAIPYGARLAYYAALSAQSSPAPRIVCRGESSDFSNPQTKRHDHRPS
jgi:hypothetical protein